MRAHGVGRLVADPVLRELPQHNTKVCEFSLVWNERVGKNKEERAHFLDCVAWSSAADVIHKYCEKGDLIEIQDALLRQDRWQNEEGKNRSKVVLRVNSFRLLPNRNKNTEDAEAEDSSQSSDKGGNDDVPF